MIILKYVEIPNICLDYYNSQRDFKAIISFDSCDDVINSLWEYIIELELATFPETPRESMVESGLVLHMLEAFLSSPQSLSLLRKYF